MSIIGKTSLIFGSSLIRLPQVTAASVRWGHWFTRFYKLKKHQRPLSIIIQKKYKELAKERLPDAKSVPKLLQEYFDDSIPESVKKIYSFEHLGIEAAIEELIQERINSFNLHPKEDATAIEIVRLTVLIRVQYEQSSVKWNRSMERRHLAMIEERDRLVERLRSENYDLFLRLLTGMQLNFSHPPPKHEIAIRERASEHGFQHRLNRTRQLCQQLKLRRLDELQGKLDSAKADFVERKGRKLKEAEEKLATLGLSLTQVLDEVYEERRASASQRLLNDRLGWFYGEQWARRNEERRLAEKERAAAAKGRK